MERIEDWYIYNEYDYFLREINFLYNEYENKIKDLYKTPNEEANEYINYLENNPSEYSYIIDEEDVLPEIQYLAFQRYNSIKNIKYRYLCMNINNKTEDRFDNEIFTINNVDGRIGDNAFEVKKHIYDFLVTDSKNEEKFAKDLENGEVTVYAKLPNGFKIPTPVGNYNPDWAIVLDNKDFKYVYFIAETKGSMSTTELRGVEKAKIKCARKHFQAICKDNVKYDVVDSYQSLIDILTKV